MSDITNELRITRNMMFNYGDAFLLDKDATYPPGRKSYGFIVLEDVVGFTCTDNNLLTGSGDYPTELSAGLEVYGQFTQMAITTSGAIKCYMERSK